MLPGFLVIMTVKKGDSEFIRNAFKSLPENLQKTITAYNKTSKVLKLQSA